MNLKKEMVKRRTCSSSTNCLIQGRHEKGERDAVSLVLMNDVASSNRAGADYD